jgi:hypothetical protein
LLDSLGAHTYQHQAAQYFALRLSLAFASSDSDAALQTLRETFALRSAPDICILFEEAVQKMLLRAQQLLSAGTAESKAAASKLVHQCRNHV